jgi:hypothetical protein
LLDLTINNVIEFGTPLFTMAYKRVFGSGVGDGSNDDEKQVGFDQSNFLNPKP